MMRGIIILNLVALSSAQLLIFPDQYNQIPVMFTGESENSHTKLPPRQAPPPLLQNQSQYWSNRVSNLISRGIAKFALDMDRAITFTRNGTSGPHENVIFSPLSLAGTMTMVLLGSSGKTFDEVSRILGFEVEVDISRHSEVVHQIFGLLLSSVDNRVARMSAPRVDYASGIFVQEGFPIRPEFQTICEVVYKSEVTNLDFVTRSGEALERVNAWVAQKTMGKITSILSEPPRPDTRVILASALYFNGEWNQHFIQSATKRKPFYIEPGQAIDIDMMYNGGDFPFYEDQALGAKIIAFPYKNFEISMYVILPKAEGANALKDFENRLTSDVLENLIGNMKNETCIIGFPRMKLSSTLRLREAFESLGLRSLFNPATADLSLLSPGYGAQVSASASSSSRTTPLPAGSQAFSVPLGIPQNAPQGVPQSVSQGVPPSIPQRVPQRVPQSIPQRVPTSNTSPLQKLPQYDEEVLIFSRFNDNSAPVTSGRKGTTHVRYEVDDYVVDRWYNGFHIEKVHRTTRESQASTRSESKRVEGTPKENPQASDRTRRRAVLNRRKRQQRPIDNAFLQFLNQQNFQSFGLDDIRNSGQTTNPGLYADQVYHKTVMEVTETGTEAAAVTAVSLNRDGSQKRMVVNRPFLFFIRHDPSKLLLFWGTVNTPTPNYSS